MKSQDRNFDDLMERFEKRIYDTGKGEWRLKLIRQDLEELAFAKQKMSVWDAGCGFGQVSQWLAQQGHEIVLSDLSEKMLSRARQNFSDARLEADFYHESIQQLASQLPPFDLVLFHAVIEWMARPLEGLAAVMSKVKSGGYLSLLFYNRNAMVYSNVLKGQWRLKPILEDSYLGQGSKLTPPNPQYPHDMEKVLTDAGFEIIKHTGVRVFHDYMTEEAVKNSNPEELFALEARYCRTPVYRDMGRYVHMLAKKSP